VLLEGGSYNLGGGGGGGGLRAKEKGTWGQDGDKKEMAFDD